MGRVARLGVVVNDLDRGRLGWIGAWLLGHLLTAQPLHAPRRAAVGAAGVPRGRDGRTLLRRPGLTPGPDDPRRVRPALRDRGACRPPTRRGRSTEPPDPIGARGDDRRRPSGSRSRSSAAGRPAPSWRPGLARRRPRGRRPRAVAGLALARRRRVRVAGGRRRAAAGRARCRRSCAAVARPIPAMRVETAARDRVPADLRRRHRRRARRRVRPVAAGSRSCSSWRRAAGADVRRGWTVTRVRPGGRPRSSVRDPDGTTGAVRARSWSARTGRTRSWPAAAGVARPVRLDAADRPDVPPRRPPTRPTCRDARMRVLRDGYVGIAPGRRRAGQRRDRARPVVAAGAAPATARAPSRMRSWPRSRPRPTTRDVARRARRRDAVAGAWPLGHRVTRRAGHGLAARRRRGRASSTRSPARASIGRSSRPSWRPPRSSRATAAATADALRRLRAGDAAPVPGQGRRVVARPGVPRPARRCSSTPPGGSPRGRRVRATMGLVMGDLVPAGRALDPRFLAALLAP